MKASATLAFLTGQSRAGSCALSPQQSDFLERLDDLACECVWKNFPYRGSGEFREVPLLRASWQNFCGYYASRSPDFADTYRQDVVALIERAELTVFLAGSSGLELFNNLGLSESHERKCRLICFGPVARRRPRHAETLLVRGAGDFISWLFFPRLHPALDCGHMGYLRHPAFLALCREQIARWTSLSCSNISA
jgi:hypothetical protein